MTSTVKNILLNITTMQPYERPFGDTVVWVTGIIIFAQLLIGLVLNSITVAVIVKYKSLRNMFVFFIFSLCISDLLSALISPLFWYRRTLGFDLWKLPNFFCKFYWAADIMTSFATALHIMAFGIFRLISIKYPHYFSKMSNKVGIVCIAAIWIICFCCGFVPFFIWFGAGIRDRYSNLPDARWPACTLNIEWLDQYTMYQKIGFSLFLFAPLVLVIIISSMTIFQVYVTLHLSTAQRNERQTRKEKQAVLQLTLIVVSFIIGYIPFTAYEIWSAHIYGSSRYIKMFDWHFGMTEYLFLRLSECMNPIFYNLGSTKMRKHTRLFLHSVLGKESSQPKGSTSGQGSESANTGNTAV